MLDEDRNDVERGTVATAHVGSGWREIDRQVRRIARRRAALDAEEAQLLVEAQRAEVHVHLGYGTMLEYLERACGYARRTAWERLRVAEALEALPGVRSALAAGKVSYSAVKELTRVATEDTEDEWLGAIETCTVREVEDLVRGRHPGDRPHERPDPAIETRTVKLELTPAAYALFREARAALERETGASMSDSELMAMVCRRALDGAAGGTSNQPPHQISMTQCRDCKRAWQETGRDSIEVPPAAIDRARCDAIELGDVDRPTPAVASRTIPAPIRRAVLARDRRRCCIPGCGSSAHIDLHHLVPRSRGGAHTMINLVALCDRHHAAAHDGVIVIRGEPGALDVRHADGRPYGAPPSLLADVRDALVTMGFKRPEAARAVATLQVERASSLEELVRAALRACPSAERRS